MQRLKILSIIVRWADKGNAIVVWRSDLYQEETLTATVLTVRVKGGCGMACGIAKLCEIRFTRGINLMKSASCFRANCIRAAAFFMMRTED